MILVSTPWQRAHLSLLEKLKERIRTHHRPERIERRGSNITPLQRRMMSRAGRQNGPRARQRRPTR